MRFLSYLGYVQFNLETVLICLKFHTFDPQSQ